MIKKILILIFTCLGIFAVAQNQASSEPQMADLFRQEGKIYVVISVISIVFVFVVALLIYIERKLKGLERHCDKGIAQLSCPHMFSHKFHSLHSFSSPGSFRRCIY